MAASDFVDLMERAISIEIHKDAYNQSNDEKLDEIMEQIGDDIDTVIEALRNRLNEKYPNTFKVHCDDLGIP